MSRTMYWGLLALACCTAFIATQWVAERRTPRFHFDYDEATAAALRRQRQEYDRQHWQEDQRQEQQDELVRLQIDKLRRDEFLRR
jgi:hypothetical protein